MDLSYRLWTTFDADKRRLLWQNNQERKNCRPSTMTSTCQETHLPLEFVWMRPVRRWPICSFRGCWESEKRLRNDDFPTAICRCIELPAPSGRWSGSCHSSHKKTVSWMKTCARRYLWRHDAKIEWRKPLQLLWKIANKSSPEIRQWFRATRTWQNATHRVTDMSRATYVTQRYVAICSTRQRNRNQRRERFLIPRETEKVLYCCSDKPETVLRRMYEKWQRDVRHVPVWSLVSASRRINFGRCADSTMIL